MAGPVRRTTRRMRPQYRLAIGRGGAYVCGPIPSANRAGSRAALASAALAKAALMGAGWAAAAMLAPGTAARAQVLPSVEARAPLLRDQRLEPGAAVFGIVEGEESRAYALADLEHASSVVHDVVGGSSIDVEYFANVARVVHASVPVRESATMGACLQAGRLPQGTSTALPSMRSVLSRTKASLASSRAKVVTRGRTPAAAASRSSPSPSARVLASTDRSFFS